MLGFGIEITIWNFIEGICVREMLGMVLSLLDIFGDGIIMFFFWVVERVLFYFKNVDGVLRLI